MLELITFAVTVGWEQQLHWSKLAFFTHTNVIVAEGQQLQWSKLAFLLPSMSLWGGTTTTLEQVGIFNSLQHHCGRGQQLHWSKLEFLTHANVILIGVPQR